MRFLSEKTKQMLLCGMLIVAMAFTVIGCGNETETPKATEQPTNTGTTDEEKTVLGEGSVSFLFTVADLDGMETQFEIHTDKETVADALLEHNLIEGEESEYGLYVKKVNGITADYDKDKTYWAFYVNGEYALAGVDATAVEEGNTYMFRVEK